MLEGQEVLTPQQSVVTEPASRMPTEDIKPPERTISRIQQFTEGLGVAPEKLSPESRQLFDELADDSKEMSDDKRWQTFKQYTESLQRDPAVKDETKTYLKTSQEVLEKHLQDGTLTKENILEGIKGVVNSPEIKLDDIQKKLVDNSLQEMQKVADSPEGNDEQKESKLKGIFNRIPRPAKIFILVALSVFSLTLLKAFKSISSEGQMGRAA